MGQGWLQAFAATRKKSSFRNGLTGKCNCGEVTGAIFGLVAIVAFAQSWVCLNLCSSAGMAT